jgi:hypothetical protein
MMEYEKPRIEEITKVEYEELTKPPYQPDRWERASKHSAVIIVGSVVIVLAIMLWVLP